MSGRPATTLSRPAMPSCVSKNRSSRPASTKLRRRSAIVRTSGQLAMSVVSAGETVGAPSESRRPDRSPRSANATIARTDGCSQSSAATSRRPTRSSRATASEVMPRESSPRSRGAASAESAATSCPVSWAIQSSTNAMVASASNVTGRSGVRHRPTMSSVPSRNAARQARRCSLPLEVRGIPLARTNTISCGDTPGPEPSARRMACQMRRSDALS